MIFPRKKNSIVAISAIILSIDSHGCTENGIKTVPNSFPNRLHYYFSKVLERNKLFIIFLPDYLKCNVPCFSTHVYVCEIFFVENGRNCLFIILCRKSIELLYNGQIME